MGRFAHSWSLTKASWSVLRQDKELLWMPVFSALASIASVLAIAGVLYQTGMWVEISQAVDGGVQEVNPLAFLLAFSLYVALAFITVFFNAAVIAGATERLAGGDPTVGSSLRAAGKRLGAIFVWSIVVATVNIILQMLRERGGQAGAIVSWLGGVAWNLATFFVIPVILFERESTFGSIKRSGAVFKKTWGETVIGQGGLGLASFVVMVVIGIIGFALFSVVSTWGVTAIGIVIGVTVAALLLAMAIFSTLGGIYKAATYRYATTGQSDDHYAANDLSGAFQPK